MYPCYADTRSFHSSYETRCWLSPLCSRSHQPGLLFPSQLDSTYEASTIITKKNSVLSGHQSLLDTAQNVPLAHLRESWPAGATPTCVVSDNTG